MSAAESVGSVSGPSSMSNLETNAESSIRMSGKKAGFTGKKLAIFVAVINLNSSSDECTHPRPRY